MELIHICRGLVVETRRRMRGKLNALVAEADDDEGGSPKVNPLQLVSALQERPPTQKGLMYVRVQINGKAVMAMRKSEAKPIQGAACVELKVGAWTGQCKLLAVPLDDFDVILGMDFMMLANAMVMPYLNGLFIANPSSTCFVQATYLQDFVRSMKKKDSLLSAMQEFKDVFPKKLPPRRAIDHAIELEPGARPPAQAPYRMAPAE
ncbi:UNVERIFIED_CONTAM: hypothetical protein Scaly_2784900 [Sesamum calycinum]|uniref:Uncharacterized protein n=1 Tax=Sesamum calycinum TaxID=2727403 RepID=A0AAW2IX67_9LAMI